MNKKLLITYSLFNLITSLLFTSCNPSLEKESNAIKQTESALSVISHDSIPEINNLINDVNAQVNAYHEKIITIVQSKKYSLQLDTIFTKFKDITNIYTGNIERYDKHLTGVQRKVFRNTLKKGIQNSARYLLVLDTISTKEYANLSDQERTKVIFDIEEKMKDEYEGISATNEYYKKRIYNMTEALLGTNKYLK